MASTQIPVLEINDGGTVNSTRFNTVGDIDLNGGALTQSASDGGAYQGYQFIGKITVGGSAASTISPGNSVGTISFGGVVTMQGGSILLAEIDGAGSSDLIVIGGNADFSGIIDVNLDGYNPVLNDLFDLADVTGTSGGSPTFDFTDAALDPGLSWDTSSFLVDGTILVAPEPAAGVLLLVGAATCLRRRRA